MPPLSSLVETFAVLAAVIDPIGTLPIFIAVAGRYERSAQRWIAVRAVIIAAGILVSFAIGGELLLGAMHVPLSAFQVSGGIVLFLFALTMIFGEGNVASAAELVRSSEETAVFPLAVPAIAGPGAMMAVVLMTDSRRFSNLNQLATTLVLLVVLALTLCVLLLAPKIHRFIGDTGTSIVSRVMGLILGSLAVSHVLEGLKEYFRA